MAIQPQRAQTQTIPNPLNAYASYTYAWSLWWLDVDDYNELALSQDVTTALAWVPGPTSYVVAEDAGLYPNRRIPGLLPVNYNIQEVNFNSVIVPNTVSRSSNVTDGELTIVEPYGLTFVDSLIFASRLKTGTYTNYTNQPFMLQLEFFGYDDNGSLIPTSTSNLFKKRFPITITQMMISAGNKGSEYKISFVPMTGMAYRIEQTAHLPTDFTIVAGTVDEFFNAGLSGTKPDGTSYPPLIPGTQGGLAYQLNNFKLKDLAIGNAQFADQFAFDIDPTIAACSIVNSSTTAMNNTNPNSASTDPSKTTFTFNRETSILALIHQIIAQSEYITKLQSVIVPGVTQSEIEKTIQNPLNTIKTTASVALAGASSNGTIVKGKIDGTRNRYPVTTTWQIRQFTTWKGETARAPTLPDSTPYTVKKYNYLYTGENVDVIDFKLDFNTTYYTAMLGYVGLPSASNPTPGEGQDAKASTQPILNVNPAILLNSIPTSTPIKYGFQVTNQQVQTGPGIIKNPQAQIGSDVLQSVYSVLGGDMIALDLTINGDPTLLKQDDWLYLPSPSGATNYNANSDELSFVKNYGHVRMDNGEVVVSVVINSPVDLDIDLTNQGLIYPQPGQGESLFSGQYRVIVIKNSFSDGVFQQTLSLARYIQSDLAQQFTAAANAGRAQTNTTNPPNGSSGGASGGTGGTPTVPIGRN
jgi:hypothetical protein